MVEKGGKEAVLIGLEKEERETMKMVAVGEKKTKRERRGEGGRYVDGDAEMMVDGIGKEEDDCDEVGMAVVKENGEKRGQRQWWSDWKKKRWWWKVTKAGREVR